MMTALTEDRHQIDAFDNRADDYVTKPFSMQVLLRRVEALLRRCGALQDHIIFGGFNLFPESYKVLYEKKEITLTPKEFDLFLYLVKHKGKVMTHESLLTNVWGFDYEGDERVVHTYIKNLRNKLPVNAIKTVRSVGYCACEEA
jgi:two-component system response regulator VanR